jgi:hypothetical protein
MGEPPVSPSAAEHPEPDRPAPLTELIQLYRIEEAMLIAHQRELERRRAAVRAAAEQEASDILLAARREIRRVLVRTRQELVTLTAQVRAAGCEALPGQSDQSILGEDFQPSAARDVRNVLRDARSELQDLSRDVVSPLPAGEEAFSDSSGAADDAREQLPATVPAGHSALYWRTAVALVMLVFVATAIVALRRSPGNEPAVATSEAASSEPTTDGQMTPAPATRPNASVAASETSGTGGSETLSMTLEIRRPVWVRMNVDGGVDPGRTYQPGERRTVRAAHEVVVRAGDAGAVFVSLGGGPSLPLGPDGLVRTRRFARDGSAVPAQAGMPPAPPGVSEGRSLEPAVASSVPAGIEQGAQAPASGQRAAAGTPPTERPERAATASDSAATVEREILARHQRWFDAFERGDHATMASLASENFSLIDQRPEPAPAVSGRVERTIQDVRVEVTGGVGAVLSGRIAETTAENDAASVVLLSEVWIRRGEEWRLVSVRMVPLNAVPAALQ